MGADSAIDKLSQLAQLLKKQNFNVKKNVNLKYAGIKQPNKKEQKEILKKIKSEIGDEIKEELQKNAELIRALTLIAYRIESIRYITKGAVAAAKKIIAEIPSKRKRLKRKKRKESLAKLTKIQQALLSKEYFQDGSYIVNKLADMQTEYIKAYKDIFISNPKNKDLIPNTYYFMEKWVDSILRKDLSQKILDAATYEPK